MVAVEPPSYGEAASLIREVTSTAVLALDHDMRDSLSRATWITGPRDFFVSAAEAMHLAPNR
jgi:hypothetical protein